MWKLVNKWWFKFLIIILIVALVAMYVFIVNEKKVLRANEISKVSIEHYYQTVSSSRLRSKTLMLSDKNEIQEFVENYLTTTKNSKRSILSYANGSYTQDLEGISIDIKYDDGSFNMLYVYFNEEDGGRVLDYRLYSNQKARYYLISSNKAIEFVSKYAIPIDSTNKELINAKYNDIIK